MSQKTYSQLKLFVQNKLDLRDEDFITDDEMLEYVEEALKYCESEIHKLNIEDQYFVAHAPIRLVANKYDYDLPSNIYANKILRIVYSNGSVTTTLNRIRNRVRFETADDERKFGVSTQGTYGYMLVNNDVRSGVKLRLYPTPREASTVVTTTGDIAANEILTNLGSTSGISPGWFISSTSANMPTGNTVQSVDSATQITMSAGGLGASVGATITFTEPRVQVWYIRNVDIPDANSDYIDFPEFWHFVAQHVIVNCLNKEVGNPRAQAETMRLEEYRKQMIETLSNMVPDQDDEIEQDLRFVDGSMLDGV
jgi:hypothetical protein